MYKKKDYEANKIKIQTKHTKMSTTNKRKTL